MRSIGCPKMLLEILRLTFTPRVHLGENLGHKKLAEDRVVGEDSSLLAQRCACKAARGRGRGRGESEVESGRWTGGGW